MATHRVEQRKVVIGLEYDVRVNVSQQREPRGRAKPEDDEAEFERRVIRAVRRELTRGGDR